MRLNHMQKSGQRIVIIGSGGHAVSVASVAMSVGYQIHKFVDSKRNGEKLLGIAIVATVVDALENEKLELAIAIGDNYVRSNVFNELKKLNCETRFPAIIHKSAVVSEFCSIDCGTVVMPNSVIGPNTRVGQFCIINTQSSVDHDCVMDDFSSLAPGAVTGGSVRIGLRSAISIGATIKHGVTIGNDTVVGGKSYVNKTLPENVLAYGIPARVVRSRTAGEVYIK
jgi:sugar O-acyltransferase (sialic acid O-acetyltransferase NeuD family)